MTLSRISRGQCGVSVESVGAYTSLLGTSGGALPRAMIGIGAPHISYIIYRRRICIWIDDHLIGYVCGWIIYHDHWYHGSTMLEFSN